MAEVWVLTAGELLDGYRKRAFSPVEVVDALGARIEAHDAKLGAFTTLCLDRAREEAAAHESAYRSAEGVGRLAGVPIGVKDLFDSAGVRTTYGSPMFADHVPARDAAALERVRRAGAILIGKTQTHEFAWGITSVNELMGTSRNPWRHDRVSGGSSGGSAVALACGFVPIALGSDTGGSIRVPSNFCGTVGLKPTYRRISAEGVFPLAASLDHPGPMARTPADAALVFSVLADDAVGPAGAAGLAQLRVGVCPDLHPVALAPEIQSAFDAAVGAVRGIGAAVVEVTMPEAADAYATFGVIQRSEALRTHLEAGLFPSRRAEYGHDVLSRLEAAQKETLANYLAATVRRERLRAGFGRAFDQVDLLLTPVSAGSPSPIGEERVQHLGEEIDFRALVMGYTVPQDLTGLPACAVRAGFDALSVPTAVQFTGPPRSEQRVLSAAQALFEATPEVQSRRPDLTVTPTL
ncbi:MAG: amidase [Solirubrobacterales bacterium]|nr:amidase [Solirubrobacterales bacterium]